MVLKINQVIDQSHNVILSLTSHTHYPHLLSQAMHNAYCPFVWDPVTKCYLL